ncbi:esterase-like activity of phytase family protein [Marivirga harenae]|uniref:esterase-like activity of phytase family protein n=1 Tax=Marivirga harenae TaxID=2010992 RepID=UPI0026DFE356|nr:esterase-like activity of phytase family protein [Marivirga harenae]WKV11100.1 esterase-like activity of phytase family protein [Marivirga harenae]
MIRSFLCLIFVGLISISCSNYQTDQSITNYTIDFIDKIAISNSDFADSTRFGGLSSIDFLGKDNFVLISDDRSEFSPARIYEMKIDFDSSGIKEYALTKTIFLSKKDKSHFAYNEIDPESIRYRKSTDTYLYGSEGGRTKEWVNPFIWEINRAGEFISAVEVPEIFHFRKEKGLRVNGGFEGLTFENDTIIWYANELPLKEDGDEAGFEVGSFPVRLVRHDIKNNNVLGQYAYNISHLVQRPIPEGGFYINSVPELLYIDNGSLWAIERSYTKGVGNFVKLFQINLEGATNIKEVNGLSKEEYKAVGKKMILDFSNFNQKIDNVEGMTFGPISLMAVKVCCLFQMIILIKSKKLSCGCFV